MKVKSPKYKGSISPYSIKCLIIPISKVDILQEKKGIEVYEMFKSYMKYNTYLFHNSSTNMSFGDTWEEYSCITPDNIVIKSEGQTRKGSGDLNKNRVPINWKIKLFSFTTPVEDIKKDLIQRIKDTCK